MSETVALTRASNHLDTAAPLVHRETALHTFKNTLSSPRTSTAYGRAVRLAMNSMRVDYLADLDPPMLAEYRSKLVARLDVDRGDRLSPCTVSLTLAALRPFLNFCRLTGTITLSKDVIAFVLNTPRPKVEKPYEVLGEWSVDGFLTRPKHLVRRLWQLLH
ncbi:hypothetical protein ACFLWA_04730 [Chloroflexota bacterium]